MLFQDIAILDEHFNYQPHSWVGVADGQIKYIGAAAPKQEEAQRYGEIYTGAGKLLMPAFCNTHAHAAMTLLRGYAENMPLQAWLQERVWPFEAKMQSEDYYWAALLACAEMARYGVASFSDMYFHSDECARAAVRAGLKANLCEGQMAFEEKPYSEYPVRNFNESLVKNWHGQDEGRIRVDFCIHAEYTSTPLFCSGLAAAAKEKGLHIHLHASETKLEHEECKARHHGLTPIRYFASLGVFDVPVIAAHCVWIDEGDMDILRERGAFAVCNPASNMKLGSGFASVPEMLKKGVKVCLGTDGMASNNNHDMMQDMYLLALLAKGSTQDPTAVSPREALYAATRAGYLAQGRADCGLIKTGFRADLCVLDISGPSWHPATSMLNNIVYGGHGSDVVLTLCDGRVVYREGKFPRFDIEEVQNEVERRTQRIVAMQ